MKNIFKGITILMIYIALAVVIAFVIDFGWEFSTKIIMPNSISIFIATVITAVILMKSIDSIFRTVEGNDVLLTVDSLFPKTLPGGQTLYNCYHSGFNIVWWWEKDGPIVNLETDIAGEFDITASTKDDDIFIKVQYDVEPDPHDLSVYILNGEGDTEQKKNIKMRVEATLKRYVETFAAYYHSNEIVTDANKVVSGEDGLQQYLQEILETESELLGINVKRVRVSEVNFSEEVSKARNDKKTIEKRMEAAKIFIDNLGLNSEEAIRRVQIENGKVAEKVYTLNADKDILPVIEQAATLIDKFSKKKKKKTSK